MFLEPQISILEGFLKDDVTLMTGVMALISVIAQYYTIYYYITDYLK